MELYSGAEGVIRNQTEAIRKADHIICISKATENTLAITSNTTSLPEVMGNGGIMLGPTREADWIDCLLKTAQGGGERDVMIERGLERLRLFSWKSTVDRHLDVYRQLI